jgi:hypothetical protein
MDTAWVTKRNCHTKTDLHTILRKGFYLREIASKWKPHALTEIEKWTRYAICHLLFFFQNPHYSYIQEHLTPTTSIFSCFFMIYQSCQTNSCHYLITNPRIFVIKCTHNEVLTLWWVPSIIIKDATAKFRPGQSDFLTSKLLCSAVTWQTGSFLSHH